MCWAATKPGATSTRPRFRAVTLATAPTDVPTSWRFRFGRATSRRLYFTSAPSAPFSGARTEAAAMRASSSLNLVYSMLRHSTLTRLLVNQFTDFNLPHPTYAARAALRCAPLSGRNLNCGARSPHSQWACCPKLMFKSGGRCLAIVRRGWSRGTMCRCHRHDPGSSPGSRILFVDWSGGVDPL